VKKFRRLRKTIVLAGTLLTLSCASFASSPKVTTPQVNLERGYLQMYNLDFPAAHDTFHAYQQERPDDPMGYVSNAAAYLFSEFDRLHILEADLFTDDQKFEHRTKLAPDPKVKTEFESELSKSDAVAGKVLAQKPNDANALFSQVLANGLRGDYTALIEKRNLASLGYMKTSRTIAQKLLMVDPTCYDAYLAVGVENYLLGINPAPVRWILRMTGSETDKSEGLQRLQLAADKGHYLAPFARLLLAVAALRDKDRQTARILLAGLVKEFPNNQLYAVELARIQ
jgi:hypothetical protein